ncbi:MAG: AAA family ATPase [Oscillospiraceae bacterium]
MRKGGEHMRDTIDEALNSLLGKRRNYTLEEIQAAQRKKRRTGGNLLETLEEMTGRGLPDLGEALRQQQKAGDLQALCQEAEAQMDELEKQLPAEESKSAPAAAKQPDIATKSVGAEAFDGLAEKLGQTVFGQEAFLRKLVIAFKRPFVMPPEPGFPRNALFVSGGENTGRHSALTALAEELQARGALASGAIRWVDLSLYPGTGEEKLFLQDLYAALRSGSAVLVFERFEACHPSYLHMLAELVTEGKCALSSRYTLQNGQLISVSNSLAAEAVGSLSAEGKYLVFLSEQPLEKLAGSFGAPFINALGDVCETAPLSREAMLRVARRQQEELTELAQKQLSFRLVLPEGLEELAVSQVDRLTGLSAVLRFYEKLLRALAQARLEQELPKDAEVRLAIDGGRVTADFGQGPVDCLSLLGERYSGDVEAVKAELSEIVGLAEVKEYVLRLEEYYAVQQLRRRQGLKAGEVSKHMIFTGSPGTGKTTIARIISRYLKAIGVLSGGQLIEVSRADLVGRYVGHTAPLTNRVIQSAIGGVLFIDEAYSLYRGRDDSFGLEAIDTLVKGMEDNRDDLIVILAGYSREMEEFLTANSGLRSRFPNIIHFPDYTGEELLRITRSVAKGKGYTVDEGCDAALLAYYNAVQATRPATAGNGRLARNKVEEAILNQSRRLAAEPSADLSALLSCDFDLSDVSGQ